MRCFLFPAVWRIASGRMCHGCSLGTLAHAWGRPSARAVCAPGSIDWAARPSAPLSRLCAGQYRLGSQTIRATVIGAGCHSAQLSGSTVFYRNVRFPIKDLSVVPLSLQEQNLPHPALVKTIRSRMEACDQAAVLALPGFCAPDYGAVRRLAQAVAQALAGRPAYIALEQDMAKALGQALALLLPEEAPCLCIDGVSLEEGSFLNVASPVGPALPVVIKTLILGG